MPLADIFLNKVPKKIAKSQKLFSIPLKNDRLHFIIFEQIP